MQVDLSLNIPVEDRISLQGHIILSDNIKNVNDWQHDDRTSSSVSFGPTPPANQSTRMTYNSNTTGNAVGILGLGVLESKFV